MARHEPAHCIVVDDQVPEPAPIASFPVTVATCHERRFDFVRCWGSEFLRDLTATFNQLAPPWTIVRIIVDGMEDRSGLEQLGSGGY